MANRFRQFRLLVWKNFILQVGRILVAELKVANKQGDEMTQQNLCRLENHRRSD